MFFLVLQVSSKLAGSVQVASITVPLTPLITGSHT